MRLINVNTLLLEEFMGRCPQYATLSHTWNGTQEISFKEWQKQHVAKSKEQRYAKILEACRLTREFGLEYLWVDTNCIDKESSAELSEAINSMFNWYQESAVCFAYLEDLDFEDTSLPESSGDGISSQQRRWRSELARSRWFTRGWTLQELLAPRRMYFFDKSWRILGSRQDFAPEISNITGIRNEYISGAKSVLDASISEVFSWLAGRETTRSEDMAYCVLGLLGLNMPLLYGERSAAFIRLQEELIRISDDQTIFCWTWDHTIPHDWSSLLAPSPSVFKGGDRFFCGSETDESLVGWSMATSYSMTNVGLRIRLPTLKMSGLDLAVLNVSERRSEAGEEDPSTGRVCIPLLTSNYVGTSDGVSSLIDGSAVGAQRWPIPARPIALYELRNIYPSSLQEFCIHPLQRNAELLKYAISLWYKGKPGHGASQMIMPIIETRKAPRFHIEVGSTDQSSVTSQHAKQSEHFYVNSTGQAPFNTPYRGLVPLFIRRRGTLGVELQLNIGGGRVERVVVGVHAAAEEYFPREKGNDDWFCYFKDEESKRAISGEWSCNMACSPDRTIFVHLGRRTIQLPHGVVARPVYISFLPSPSLLEKMFDRLGLWKNADVIHNAVHRKMLSWPWDVGDL
ncbi:HET domain-containing protein [Colletotrichum costaricense]|uniref:HET domain-containing protein n=1 Tax=Colletotrichum costaricense TaxID=1209916 RepID=A0AAJ0DYC1_9PEZI|nr:HET domain-containing protein [Colletotrichum costaricense]KAK1520490.1 HET domain-containing protein [Colletotrichum costaricense]